MFKHCASMVAVCVGKFATPSQKGEGDAVSFGREKIERETEMGRHTKLEGRKGKVKREMGVRRDKVKMGV
jgi:hypothetical protein